jgi:CHAD domain-containing protein
MSFLLSLSEPLADEVRRVAREQLDGAVAGLRDADADRVAAVHDARKSVKKVRALLRLVAADLPKPVVRRENRALRDAGRLLSGTRDADVLVQSAGDLARRYVGRVPAASFEELRERLAAPGAAAGDVAASAAAAAAALEAIAGRVATWPTERCSGATLRRGMTTSYARGRTARRVALAKPTSESLHEWRKRVKDLWYHERLLQELWPPVLKAHAESTKELSEHLGDDHDLSVLRCRLTDDAALTDAPRLADDEVVALVDERRAQLQRQAFALGRRIYADAPKTVAPRLKAWLVATREETINDPERSPLAPESAVG